MVRILSNTLVATLILILLIAVSFLVLSLACSSTMSRVEWQETTYRVQSGDSLWAISHDYCPDGVDRREWVEEIRELNGLTGSIIYPGQTLTVLVAAEED